MAKARRTLNVWLYGKLIAELTEPSPFRYQLDFTDEALDVHGEGARVLSLSLPFSSRPIVDRKNSDRRVAAFLDGLLPEGNVRHHIADYAGISSNDVLGLLDQVGKECAGAIQFLQQGVIAGSGRIRPLSDLDVTRMVADLPTYHLPEGASPQASLAGVQDKVLLTKTPDGWGWPEDGAASSHIIKPSPVGPVTLPYLVLAEDWAMRVANLAEIPAAQTCIEKFDGRDAIVVTRYDRQSDGTRIHQEDFCQALGLQVSNKYEGLDTGGPTRLAKLASIASPRAVDPNAFRSDLLAAVSFNILIGNGDAHSKNYSILLGRQGEVSLAPIYDAAPVMFMDRQYKGTGHVINGRTNIDWVLFDDLICEGVSWGLARKQAINVVQQTIDSTLAAVESTDMPEQIFAVKGKMQTELRRRELLSAPTGSGPPSEGGGDVWVDGYTNRNGTYVAGHTRSRSRR